MATLVVLDDGADVLDTANGESFEEGDERNELLGRGVALAGPGGELDGVLGLKLEVLGVCVKNDGTLEGATEVRQILLGEKRVRPSAGQSEVVPTLMRALFL